MRMHACSLGLPILTLHYSEDSSFLLNFLSKMTKTERPTADAITYAIVRLLKETSPIKLK